MSPCGSLVAESIEKILKDHSSKHISSDLSSQITVRRTHIWEDSLRLFRRIDASKTLRVTFLGEAGVDDGGPRREYLRLLMSAISNQGHLLTGPPSCKVPLHNTLALSNGCFHKIGVFIVMSLSQGGPGPTFFSSSVVDYLFGGTAAVKACIDDIPDEEVCEKLHKVIIIISR